MADLLSEKVHTTEQEAAMLAAKAQEAEKEIERARQAAFKVCVDRDEKGS